MAQDMYRESFFEELEAAAKGLSITDADRPTDLKSLFEDLKRSFRTGDEPVASSDRLVDATRPRNEHHV